MFSEAIAAMKPGCVLISAQEWLVGAGVDGHVCCAEFDGVESIAGRLRDGDISSDGRDCHDANAGRAQRHDERDGVVGSGVGIDQEGARHGARITNCCPEQLARANGQQKKGQTGKSGLPALSTISQQSNA